MNDLRKFVELNLRRLQLENPPDPKWRPPTPLSTRPLFDKISRQTFAEDYFDDLLRTPPQADSTFVLSERRLNVLKRALEFYKNDPDTPVTLDTIRRARIALDSAEKDDSYEKKKKIREQRERIAGQGRPIEFNEKVRIGGESHEISFKVPYGYLALSTPEKERVYNDSRRKAIDEKKRTLLS